MKFGLYSSIANPPRGEHLDRCIDEVIAEAQLAEASGFDSCFFGEHHQDHDGFLPSPLIVATAVAARTHAAARRHLGDPAAAPPSGARGRGRRSRSTSCPRGASSSAWASAISPPTSAPSPCPWSIATALFEESVEILRLCWAGEQFSFRGKHYTLEDVQIRPRPYPEVGAAALDRRQRAAAARRAGRLADGFVGTPSTSLANATQLADVYKEAAREGRRGRPRSSRCATPGSPDARRGRRGVRPARDDRLPLLLGEPPGRVPQHRRPTRSSRWRISPPIA